MTRKPIRYRYFWFLFILLVACGRQQDVTPTETLIPTVVSPTPFPTSTVIPITDTPHTAAFTFPAVPLPNDLVVAYVIEDALWIWTQNGPQVLLQQQNISAPLFSEDGQWIFFRQRHISLDGINPTFDELWVVRTDGSEIERVVGSDDLMALTGKKVLLDYFSWLPGQNKILFQTEEIIDGPPGSRPLFDLYSVNMEGEITQLLEPDDAGRFVPSPDGVHLALVTGSSIKVFDLESGKQQTLLEFEPVGFPSDGGLRTPKVVWDTYGKFLITSILPKNLYYPELYAGEPEQVWRLFLNGQVELVAELQPVSQNHAGISVSPNLKYFFYLNDYCPDAMGMLYVRDLTSAEEQPVTCVWNIPQWLPDSEHFIYNLGDWQLGSIYDTTSQPLDILNVPTDPNARVPSQMTWINDEYFLVVLRRDDLCTLNVATLPGVVTEITRTPPDNCPRGVTFSLAK